jgi:large subunit ribosomal protein L21
MKMHAIIKTGGKQYSVKPGDVIRIEKLDREPGEEVELTEVLFVGGDEQKVGRPFVNGAKVTLVVTKQKKAPKVIIFKKKRRQGYRRFKTHRQPYTEVLVKNITFEGKAYAAN